MCKPPNRSHKHETCNNQPTTTNERPDLRAIEHAISKPTRDCQQILCGASTITAAFTNIVLQRCHY